MTSDTPKYARRPFPADSLEEAIELAQAIQDQNNGRPMNRVLLANAVGRRPASSQYKELLSSAFKYGLTLGTEKSDTVSLTELGVAITKPRDSSERAAALKSAALHPDLFRRIFEHYNNGKLPQGNFFLSALERDFRVPRERCQECSDTLIANGRVAGIVRELKGTLYVILDAEATDAQPALAEDVPADLQEAVEPAVATVPPSATAPPPEASGERYIFIAHGKNRKPLDQLEKVLKQFGIPYKVAIYEPQMARPISEKVAHIMRECHSAILIFTADEQFKTPDDEVVWRPSQNVIYELGAASILYQNRIVIFKEEGLDFPTDFRDIGNISFEKDKLDAKGVDLIKELIGLGLIKVQPA